MGALAWLFAAVYDRSLAATERAVLGERRDAVLGGLAGRVLEIGAGTGANLAHYPAAVSELVLTEPAPAMARRLRQRLARSGRAATFVEARAEALPFPDASFDAAVTTLALCTVADPARALGELRRVLAPGGRLAFIEHVRADDPRLARLQDRLERPWRLIGQGCHCNRSTEAAIVAAGFTVERVEHTELKPAPALVRPLIAGIARAPAVPAVSART